jgi:hypothetical protein
VEKGHGRIESQRTDELGASKTEVLAVLNKTILGLLIHVQYAKPWKMM